MKLYLSKQCTSCAEKDATIAALLSSISRLEKRADEERKAQQDTIKDLIARLPQGWNPGAAAPIALSKQDVEEGFQRIFDEEGFDSVILPVEA